MRFALATVALFAASASASVVLRRQNIPACGTACITSADTSDCSNATDEACLCNSQAFISSVVTCFEQSCQGADLTAAEQAGEQLCAAAGVTLSNLPTGSATTAGTSSTASGSVSAGTPASSVTSSASSSSSAIAPISSTTNPATTITSSVSKTAATSALGSGTTIASSSTGSAAPASSSTSAGSIVGISSFAGLAAFGLAALTL